MTRIFDIEEKAIKINENCYLIPELKAVIDKYDDPIPAMAYCYYMCAPDSPYANLDDDEKSEVILQDVGGDFSLEDEEIDVAIEKLNKLMLTRTQKMYKSAGINLDKLCKYMETTEIDGSSRDGNLGELIRIQTGLPKILENYKKLAKMADEEQQQKLRGSAQVGMY